MFVSIFRYGLLYSNAISTVRMYSTFNIYIANKAVPFGPMGPWRPRSTSHSIVCVWRLYTMELQLIRPYMNVRFLVSYMIRTPRVFEGCFLDLRLLLLCIGVWPCRTVFVDFHVFWAAATHMSCIGGLWGSIWCERIGSGHAGCNKVMCRPPISYWMVAAKWLS